MSEKVKKRPGPVSLFPGKRRAPVSLTLTPGHHKKVENNMRRLGITRADLIGLLIEKYADSVMVPGKERTYERLRDAVTALGGMLEQHKFSGPHGETWVLQLSGKRLPIRSAAKTFPLLDGCYRSKPGAAASATPNDNGDINPAGLADLFKELATS